MDPDYQDDAGRWHCGTHKQMLDPNGAKYGHCSECGRGCECGKGGHSMYTSGQGPGEWIRHREEGCTVLVDKKRMDKLAAAANHLFLGWPKDRSPLDVEMPSREALQSLLRVLRELGYEDPLRP